VVGEGERKAMIETIERPAGLDPVLRLEVAEYLYYLAHTLDEFELQKFIDEFTDDGRYVLIPRENHAKQLPVCVIDDDRDRLIYRKGLILKHWQYEPFRENRIIGNTLVQPIEGGVVRATSNFTVFHTNFEGSTKLHMTGVFHDDLVHVQSRWKIKRRYAILDTFLPDEAIVVPP